MIKYIKRQLYSQFLNFLCYYHMRNIEFYIILLDNIRRNFVNDFFIILGGIGYYIITLQIFFDIAKEVNKYKKYTLVDWLKLLFSLIYLVFFISLITLFIYLGKNKEDLFNIIIGALINAGAMIIIGLRQEHNNRKRDMFEEQKYKSDIEREAFIIYTQLTNVQGCDMNKKIIKTIEEIDNGRFLSLYTNFQLLQMTSEEVRNKIKELCERCLKYKENNNKLY